MKQTLAWTEYCKSLAPAIVETCAKVSVSSGPGALVKALGAALPEWKFRHALSRGGWYRLGGILDHQGERVSDNLESWVENALDERDGDFAALSDDFIDKKLYATRLVGQTHYDDQCVNNPEDKDGDEDTDGCPESRDGDRDGDRHPRLPRQVPRRPRGQGRLRGPRRLPRPGQRQGRHPRRQGRLPRRPGGQGRQRGRGRLPRARSERPGHHLRQRHPDPREGAVPTGSAKILEQSFGILDAVANTLKEHPEFLLVEVQGHADERAPDAYNLKLTKDRAKSVVDALINRKVDKGRLRPMGFGEYCPLDPASNDAAWEKNRRVEFKIVRTKDGPTGVELGCETAKSKGVQSPPP